ncbi:hypothetical protein, partial [Chromohalobacter sp. HP20-39]|uniref:hypothetical protein n=1 Tax=Chromohalobacter sp. HP20-39 TaxID=3079306 RepID=UPI00294B7361
PPCSPQRSGVAILSYLPLSSIRSLGSVELPANPFQPLSKKPWRITSPLGRCAGAPNECVRSTDVDAAPSSTPWDRYRG